MIRRLLTGLVLAVLLWLFFLLGGRALCYIAIGQIAELTNTKITTESVNFNTNGSVFIKNLVISPYTKQSGDNIILKSETVHARFSLSSILLLRPRLKVIDVNNFLFNARYDLDTGQWNLSALKIGPFKTGADKMPLIHLKAGTLQYTKISKGREDVAVSVPINARIGFNEETQKGCSFEIMTAAMPSGFGKSRLTGFWRPGSVTIAGGISSMDIPELEMAWIIDVMAAELKYDQSNAFSLKLRIKDLHSNRSPTLQKVALVGPAFLERSGPFNALQRFFDRYQPKGRVDIDLDVSGNLNRLTESKLTGKVYCKDVEFCYYKFHYPIEHLAGQIDFTTNSVALNNLSGNHGDIQFFINGWSRDFGPNLKYQIQITSNNMPLDDDLYNALSTQQQEFWSSFSPSGYAAIDYRLSRKSQTDKQIKLAVELLGAEAVYKHFPYPLQKINGNLFFDRDNVVFSDVVSQVDKRKIILNGQITIPGTDKPIYDISVKVNNIPLDSTLEAALPEKQKSLYKQFCPAGYADGWIKISTQDSGTPGFTADLSFKEACLKSEQFPLPVSDISAKAIFTPDLIIVKDFYGRYGDNMFSMTGQIQPVQEHQQVLYSLALKLEETRLNDDLLNLLPELLKNIISDLKPEGQVNLSANLKKDNLTRPPDYSIIIDCLEDSVTIPQFAYPLKDITGTLAIDAGSIKLRDINATLGGSASATEKDAAIKLNGEIILTDGAFTGALLHLRAEDIFFNEQLGLALPQRFRPLYSKLSPTGRFDLALENIRINRSDDGQKSIDFAGAISLKNCGLRMSGSRIELAAVLDTKGLYRTGDGFSTCRATINGGALKIQGKSLTDLRASIFYDPNSRNWYTEDLFADCYDGNLKGKFECRHPTEQTGEYVLQAGFDNVDLQQFLSDTEETELQKKSENGYTSGKMNGSLSLKALIGDDSSRIGTCRLAVSDMQVGKLSPLARLLQVLQLTEPKDYAFNRMFFDSYIRHNGLYVKNLDLSGQSLAFYGSGWMDLQSRNVDLTLTARGKRLATDDPSVLQSLTEGLGRAVIRMEVTGNYNDPKVITKTLPVIERTLQILGTKPATPD